VTLTSDGNTIQTVTKSVTIKRPHKKHH